MRRLLDSLYDGAAYLAAVCMVGLLGMILTSIISRLLHFMVPGADSYAGYLMAGAGFLALAHTFKRGEHIRVGLLLNALQGKPKKVLEIWALLVSSLIGGALAWYSVRLVWLSYIYHDVSTGNDATPLWIPQIAMALGAVVLLIALIDELILEIMGKRQPVAPGEALRNE
jgi:TRAP-type C4-dicarboxylate transport system permease small subunit